MVARPLALPGCAGAPHRTVHVVALHADTIQASEVRTADPCSDSHAVHLLGYGHGMADRQPDHRDHELGPLHYRCQPDK